MRTPPFHDLDLELSIDRTETPPPVVPKEHWVDKHGRLFAWSARMRSESRLEVSGTGVFCFTDHSREVKAFVGRKTKRARVERDFLRVVRPLLLQARGWQLLHASAVLTTNGIVGLCGGSGAGKSTVARTWAKDKHRLWADDAVLLRIRYEAMPESIQLPLDAIGSPTATVTATARPLLALVILETCGRTSSAPTLEELRPATALSAVLPHALCFDSTDPDLEKTLFLTYSSLVRQLPVHRLRYRQTPPAANTLASLLQERFVPGFATLPERGPDRRASP